MKTFIFMLLGVLSTRSQGSWLEGTVYLDQGQASFTLGKLDKAGAAYGTYNESLLSSGWDILDVKAGYGKGQSNRDLMYAAGYLEGAFTAQQIWAHYLNMKKFFLGGRTPEVVQKVRQFLADQDKWSRDMVQKNGEQDPFWRQISYIIAHLDGLSDGYKSMAQKDWETDFFVVQFLNGVGDMIDLMHALDPANRPDYSRMGPHQLKQYVSLQGHCSALIKVTGAYENLYMSHSSWFSYSATLRIYKHYDFNLKDDSTAAKQMSFSSYPGFLESLDDFYLLSSKMVMLQTTNNIFNMDLYKLVKPQSLLAWQRVRAANQMAHSGKEWADVLGRYNSGTYNNQYMVIDLKQIHLEKDIGDNALWVVEQIPGLVRAADQTPVLRTGYWPSYNVPFYEDIYNKSGYPQFVKEHGLDFSYQLAPRAKIFRRDQNKVLTFADMQHIMRYNDYKHDKYSEDNPCDTICCRGDLDPLNPSPMGCYDTKVTNYEMALKRQAYAINGPTLGDDLSPFSWTGRFANMSHVGLPQMYKFGWIYAAPYFR